MGHGHERRELLRDVVYERVRDRILDGSLPADAKLPSTRAYAAELGLARGTVEEAYARLAAEGYVVGLGPAGTRVRALEVSAPSRPAARHARVPSDGDRFAAGRGLPLGLGVPGLSEFPFEAWARSLARAARRTSRKELASTDAAGEASLRVAIAAHVGLARGVRCEPSQIVVTSGYQSALVLAALATVGPRGTAHVEDPGYPKTREALAALGLRVIAAKVDGEGLRVDTLGGARPALVAVTASHQMPTGVCLSLARRLALLDWASSRDDRWLVEDDYDGEFHYSGSPLPALFAVDRHERTLHAGTFSKSLFPGLRVGFLVAPPGLAAPVRRLSALVAPSVPAVVQRALADFIASGKLARHVARMRKLYARRRAAVLDALREHLGGRAVVEEGSGGLHLLVHWRGGPDDRDVARRGAAQGLGVRALGEYRLARASRQGVLVGFANVPERSAAGAVARLAAAFDASPPPGGP
jgi:GntR family transcriptional regulator/MocR family aminotransferase